MTISKENILSLRREATEHGDDEQVALCDRALAGDDSAWCECEQIISEAA